MRFAALLGCLALAVATPSPVRADAATTALQAKVRAALHSAKSFVETATLPRNPMALLGSTAVFTVVAPNRYRQDAVAPPGGHELTVIIGHEVYGNEGKGWSVQTWTDRLVTGFEDEVFGITIVSVAPNRGESDSGRFVMKDPRGAKETDVMECEYDTKTFRPSRCSGDGSTIVFSRWDDPAVKIETPPNAKRVDK